MEHRAPVPVVTIALLWKWPRWAATTLVIFPGVARPGGVLKACWEDVLLPADGGECSTPRSPSRPSPRSVRSCNMTWQRRSCLLAARLPIAGPPVGLTFVCLGGSCNVEADPSRPECWWGGVSVLPGHRAPGTWRRLCVRPFETPGLHNYLESSTRDGPLKAMREAPSVLDSQICRLRPLPVSGTVLIPFSAHAPGMD